MIEARQDDELVVEHAFKAVTNEEDCDVEEYSTGDDNHSDGAASLALHLLGVKEQGDLYGALRLKPAILLKSQKAKFVRNPHQLQCITTPAGITHTQHILHHFIPYSQAQLHSVGGDCIISLDSASAHILQGMRQTLRQLASGVQ